MATRTINGVQASEINSSNESFDVIDLTGATFPGPDFLTTYDYPMRVTGSTLPRVTLNGGQWNGNIPTNQIRQSSGGGYYPGWNSAGLFCQGVPVTIDGARFGDPFLGYAQHDVMRINGASIGGSIVQNVEVWRWRDDFIESDDNDGDIDLIDCFGDYGYVGISSTGSTNAKAINMTRVKLGLRSLFPDPNASTLTHAHPFKNDTGSTSACPTYTCNDCVIAIDNPGYTESGYSRLANAFANMNGSGNEFLIIGDVWNPSFPTLPAGWTLYENETARRLWNTYKREQLGYGFTQI